MSPRTLGPTFGRPAAALSGRPLLVALTCVFAVAAAWGLFMHSAWVAVTTAGLGLLPLWTAERERETLEARFRFTLLAGGLMAALQLGFTVWRV